ncbi:MAG: HlyD family efflux transporter periplasmic adaptor subunit [Oscillibacter sp.]|nr:HlyD family efflux transporter periplasmic adaptor subunit [Oscillibacter sp.]
MEVKEKSKKRELIKTIAIVFLAVLLVLTFFSGTIMNYSLPEVATQLVSSGTINAKIRGSGTVAANESYEVVIQQTREIRSVCLGVGQEVQAGDLLFVLGDIESQELRSAQEALANAKMAYERRRLELAKSYESDDQNLKIIREDLEEVYARRDANYVTDEEVSYAKGDLAAAKSELDRLQFELKELNALQSDSEEYANAKAKVTELESRIKSLDAAIEEYEAQLEKLESGEDVAASRRIEDAEAALSKAENEQRSSWMAYIDDLNALIRRMNTNNGDGLSHYIGRVREITTSSPSEIDASDQMYIEAYLTEWEKNNQIASGEDKDGNPIYSTDATYLTCKTAYNVLIKAQEDVEEKAAALDRLVKDQNISSGDARQQRQAIQNKLDEAEFNRRGVQWDLSVAQTELEAASNADDQLKQLIRSNEANQRQKEAEISTLQDNLTTLQEKQTIYKTAVETAGAKERELEQALSGKNIDKQLNNLDLQSMSMDIQKYQEQVDKYTKDSVDTEITSPVTGVITAINVTAGKETTPGQAMAVIDVVDRGYTIKVSVTNEQAKQVKVGDTAEVTNYYWGSSVAATLEQIVSDPSSMGQKKTLVFRLTGDVSAGDNLSLSIGQRSANFDTIVPKSALREDANGKFVLVVTSKNTPLGNRYTATRADVQVLAEDDTSAAVSGLAANDYVITTASKPISPGSQVRMVENP